MYSRNLFVLDFARKFFVSCAQIFEALALRPPLKFGCDWRKIGRKSKCRKDSESTFFYLERFQEDIYHLIRNNGCPYSTTSSLFTRIASITPSYSLSISFISFIASIMPSTCPFFTVSPSFTKLSASGEEEL